MYYFTADEHYGHAKIIEYCSRPFANVDEMNDEIIRRHNEVVTKDDTVWHAGDFTLSTLKYAENIIRRLNGQHFFVRGSHDKWLEKIISEELLNPFREFVELRVDKQTIVVICHYAMRVWPRSHYNSWQVYGHSHGHLPPQGKQWDVGVDNNNFYPVSLDQLTKIMAKQPDNFNLVKKKTK
jgi:calcineurin-like phosphoesterase family protein